MHDTEFTQVDLTYLLNDMDARGVSDRQREAVSEALESGEMAFEVVADLFDDHVQCLEDAGFAVSGIGNVERAPEVRMVTARISPPASMTNEQWGPIEIDCMVTHYVFAEQYYLSQPSSRESYLQSFDAQRESILGCLMERGMTLEPDVTRVELLYAVSEAEFRYPDQAICWDGAVFDNFLPPGTSPSDFED